MNCTRVVEVANNLFFKILVSFRKLPNSLENMAKFPCFKHYT